MTAAHALLIVVMFLAWIGIFLAAVCRWNPQDPMLPYAIILSLTMSGIFFFFAEMLRNDYLIFFGLFWAVLSIFQIVMYRWLRI
jgi:hypothetical protein